MDLRSSINLWPPNKNAATTLHSVLDSKMRNQVFESNYWKKKTKKYITSAGILVDRAMTLDHIGGFVGPTHSNPTPFLCLVVLMLQFDIDKQFVIDLLRNSDYKYPRVVGAFYMRLMGSDADLCQYLEPLQLDKQNLWRRLTDGSFAEISVGALIAQLLTEECSCDVALPKTTRSSTLKSLFGWEIQSVENAARKLIQEKRARDGKEIDQDTQHEVDGRLISRIGGTCATANGNKSLSLFPSQSWPW